jgi:hypothetical protein
MAPRSVLPKNHNKKRPAVADDTTAAPADTYLAINEALLQKAEQQSRENAIRLCEV